MFYKHDICYCFVLDNTVLLKDNMWKTYYLYPEKINTKIVDCECDNIFNIAVKEYFEEYKDFLKDNF